MLIGHLVVELKEIDSSWETQSLSWIVTPFAHVICESLLQYIKHFYSSSSPPVVSSDMT
jgi:hypothetical protein